MDPRDSESQQPASADKRLGEEETGFAHLAAAARKHRRGGRINVEQMAEADDVNGARRNCLRNSQESAASVPQDCLLPVVAFDGMLVPWCALPVLPLLAPLVGIVLERPPDIV